MEALVTPGSSKSSGEARSVLMRTGIGAWTSLAMALAGCSGGDSAAPPPPPPANRAPVITSAATRSFAEGTADASYAITATDADNDPITFALAGGVDAGDFHFELGSVVAFNAPPDFEAPTDANGDNVYEIIVSASDGTATTTLAVRITVTDVADAFGLRRVVSGLSQPLFLLGRGDGSNRVFIVEKAGQVEILDPTTGALNAAPFLDLRTVIDPSGEQGLLGMALAPDFAASGTFYVHLNNLSGDTEIRRYRTQTANPDLADLSTGDVIFTATQPAASNHKGGFIGFGPDNLLYIALGDGGGSNDAFGNGQNRNSLLAKILRIDPSSDGFPTDPSRDYAIPSGNPFAGGGGAPETFAYGLRNPFRASFDRQTGNLFIGDVGQGAIEEISLIRPGEAGLNFGWPVLEGTRVNQAGSTAGMTAPIAEYAHGSGPRQGNSVTGGYVYRGPVDVLRGQYVFGDFASANIWSIPAASAAQGTTVAAAAFTIQTAAFAPDLGVIDNIASFGEDDAGNLYVVGLDGEVFRVEPR
ncbi:MAG TPA: cadherin domain-containing protein [Parvularcula sp.]|nr:cadherin domain-containing protein [Parvularcula sp.]